MLLSLLLGLFSVAGYIQAGMLQPPGYQTAAWIYAWLFIVSAAGFFGVVGLLVLRAVRRDRVRRAS